MHFKLNFRDVGGLILILANLRFLIVASVFCCNILRCVSSLLGVDCK